ncbi:hypothetical protein L2E82_27457 [Cichorium intybus]|uniref:Uncharacterized protein n=1 Tax=Cichorium intybus TaxID=13427 RepID=A0ACB9CT31_CICIN|nr:hypothetical protein L2E82_27457 [Cichorium intybus]
MDEDEGDLVRRCRVELKVVTVAEKTKKADGDGWKLRWSLLSQMTTISVDNSRTIGFHLNIPRGGVWKEIQNNKDLEVKKEEVGLATTVEGE